MVCLYCKKDIPDGSVFCNFCGRKQEREYHRKANGSGTVYKRGNTYTAKHRTYRNGFLVQKTKGGFKTKKDAYAWLKDNPPLKTIAKNATILQLYTDWSKMHFDKLSKKKEQAYRAAWKCCEAIQAYTWEEVSLAQLQACVDKAKATHNQRKTVKTVLRSIEKYAVRNGITERQLAQHLEIPSATKPQKVPFTDAEIKRVWKAYESDPFAGAVLIMLYTGMRFGEISTIKPENIHLDEGYLMGGKKSELGKYSEILIIDKIKPIIRAHMKMRNEYAMSSTAFRKHFDAVDGCQGHKPHECRHTTATLLANANVPPATISAIMRHTSYQQTLEYTHISREDKRAALAQIV